jgi:hypothetical protein
MSAFLSFRCLVTAKLLAAVLLAAAPIDASHAANLLINGKTGKCLTIAGGTSPDPVEHRHLTKREYFAARVGCSIGMTSMRCQSTTLWPMPASRGEASMLTFGAKATLP